MVYTEDYQVVVDASKEYSVVTGNKSYYVERLKSLLGVLVIKKKSIEAGGSYQLREPAVPYIAHFGGKKE